MSEKTISKTSIDSSVNSQFAILLALAEKAGKVVDGQGGEVYIGVNKPDINIVSAFAQARGYEARLLVHREHGMEPEYIVSLTPYDPDKSQMIKRLSLP